MIIAHQKVIYIRSRSIEKIQREILLNAEVSQLE